MSQLLSFMAKYSQDLDRLFAILADPTRRAIVARLARGPATVSELASGAGMALPSFMGHLQRLGEAGLVASDKKGRVRTFRLLPEALAPARHWLDEQRLVWSERLDRFDDYALRLHKERKHGPEPRSGD